MNQQQRENKNSNFLKNSSHFNLKNNQQDQLKSKRRHSWKGYSNKRKTQYIVSVADQRWQMKDSSSLLPDLLYTKYDTGW